MLKIAVTTLIVLSASISSANAEKLKGGYPACLTENLFNQLTSAITKNNKPAMRYLMKHGCIITKSGIDVTVLHTTWTGISKVRAYSGNNAVVIWTNMENIQH